MKYYTYAYFRKCKIPEEDLLCLAPHNDRKVSNCVPNPCIIPNIKDLENPKEQNQLFTHLHVPILFQVLQDAETMMYNTSFRLILD